MPSPKYITPKEAQDVSVKLNIPQSPPTITKHAEKNKYGHKVGGRWFINEAKFRRYLHGKK